MSGFYWILDADGRTPIRTEDAELWCREFESPRRIVAKTQLPNGVRVSTVFLGLNHRLGGDGPPILFETMVFGGRHDQEMTRCSTWEQAEQMHAAMVEAVVVGSLPSSDDDEQR